MFYNATDPLFTNLEDITMIERYLFLPSQSIHETDSHWCNEIHRVNSVIDHDRPKRRNITEKVKGLKRNYQQLHETLTTAQQEWDLWMKTVTESCNSLKPTPRIGTGMVDHSHHNDAHHNANLLHTPEHRPVYSSSVGTALDISQALRELTQVTRYLQHSLSPPRSPMIFEENQ